MPAIPKDAHRFATTSVHVEDLARFAVFAASRPESLGEDYNVVDDSIVSCAEFTHYIALLTGRRLREIPIVRNAWLRPAMVGTAWAWTQLERRFGIPRARVLEVGSATKHRLELLAIEPQEPASGLHLPLP